MNDIEETYVLTAVVDGEEVGLRELVMDVFRGGPSVKAVLRLTRRPSAPLNGSVKRESAASGPRPSQADPPSR